MIHEDDIARAEHVFNERRAGDRNARNIEIDLKCNPGVRRPRLMNGRCKSVELTATGMYDEEASPFERRFIGSYGVAKDVTERKQAEETVHYQAYHDLLTGLPNRALFRDHLGLMLAQAKRNQQPLAVLSLDLDHFKVINDSLGHTIGDELLLAVGARLRQCLREGDTLARLGGDEFAVLLPTLVSRSDVEHIGRKIIQVLSKPVYVKSHEIYISVSIGACVAPEDGDLIDSLIRQAEIAMYQAKSQGRSRLQFWESGMQAPYSERMQIEADLRRALARNEFVLFYQPQVDTITGEVRGFEALLRWWHPQRGLLTPADFIPVAEESGVIVPIGDWVMRQAGAQMAEWRKAGLPPVRLSVNISARQLESPDFVDSIMRAVAGLFARWPSVGAGNHRKPADARFRGQRHQAWAAVGCRHPARHRRLRYGIQFVQIPVALSHPHPENRSVLRAGSRPRRKHVHRQRHDRHGARHESQRRRRRRRNRIPARALAADAMP